MPTIPLPAPDTAALPAHDEIAHRARLTRLVHALLLALLLVPPLQPLAFAADPAATATATATAIPGSSMGIGFEARQLVDWIARSDDHAGKAFVIVDKKRAQVLVFDADALLHAASAVLLGSALGDDSVDGIGLKPIAQVLPAERTTPAGRFVGERGRNAKGEDVVWVDYDAAVSMHRVRTGNALERRAERLATPSIDDNRISYGCINVPVAFYESYLRPLFAVQHALVYVLPDSKPLQQVFGAIELAATRAAPAHGQFATEAAANHSVAGKAITLNR